MKITVLALLFATALTAAEAPPSPVEWSDPVDGLRGRLVIEYGPDFEGAEIALVYLELQNVSDSAGIKDLWFDETHQFKWQLQDEKGNPVPRTYPPMSVFSDLGHWMGLPFDSTLRFRVSVSGYGIIPNGGIALQLPSGFFWQVPRKKEGSYYLSATFSSVPAKEERKRSWKGTLVLPKVMLPPKAK
jgi:hypothetical protein